jgi:outer membrane protein
MRFAVSVSLLAAAAVSWSTPARAEPAAPVSPPPGGEALTLAQAEQNALHNQPTLHQADGQTEAAAGRVEEARAGYLPQVTATGTYERTTGNYALRPGAIPTVTNVNGMAVVTATPAVNWTPSFNAWSFGVTGSQLIYDFNATADRWRSAAVNRDAAESNGHVVVLNVLLNVRRAYFLARGERDLARVAEEAVANQQKHLDQITDMVHAGMRSQIDLATEKTALANARVQAVTAENNYASGLAILDQAMGMPSDRTYDLTDTELGAVPGEDGDLDTLTAQAVKARPELVLAEQQRQAQELLVGSYRGNYGPALSAIASLTDVGTKLDSLAPNWFVGLSLSWAILSGGLTHGQVREAKGTLAALTAQADIERLQVSVDVEQGRLAVRGAKSTIGGAEEALSNAREQLRLAEARYQTGQGSIIELADAQVAYTTAEAQEVSARFGLASARAQLLAALGDR